jgi:hypothetical protein
MTFKKLVMTVAIGVFVSPLLARSSKAETYFLCLQPVFKEEVRLRANLDGSASKTREVAAAINYLRQKYCRAIETDGRLPAGLQPLDSEDVGNTGGACNLNSGMFRGERVYWGACHE